MEVYKHSLEYYENLLDETKEKIASYNEKLNYLLGLNTGKILTHEGNAQILEFVKCIATLNYNEAHYNSIVDNIRKGRVKAGKD